MESPESPFSGRSVAKRFLNNRGSVITRFGSMVLGSTDNRQDPSQEWAGQWEWDGDLISCYPDCNPEDKEEPQRKKLSTGLEKEYLNFFKTCYRSGIFKVIENKADAGWKSLRHPMTVKRIARMAVDDESTVGIRPEGQTRLVVIDVDNKPGKQSIYWHPTGKSTEIQKVIEIAEDHGCISSVLVSSNSKGLHIYVSLPEWVPCYESHWIGRLLLGRAGMGLGAAQAELFPSELPYAPEGAVQRPQSAGIRLPGQEGSALVVGDRTITDPELILKQLQCDVEEAQTCLKFKELVEEAAALRKQQKRYTKASSNVTKVNTADAIVEWTGPSQSNDNLGKLTMQARVRYKPRTPEQLAAITERLALESPGFKKYASAKTQKRLLEWCMEWAVCSFKRAWKVNNKTEQHVINRDSNRNERLFNESRERLSNLQKKLGEAAKKLSKNQVRKMVGMGWATVQKHWDYWLGLSVEGVHHTPPHKGVHREPNPAGGRAGAEARSESAEFTSFSMQNLQNTRKIIKKAPRIPQDTKLLQALNMEDLVSTWILDDLHDFNLEPDTFLSRRL